MMVPNRMPDEVRKLIDRGLARYGRGELSAALAEWEGALGLDPENAEARNLIEFVRAKLPADQTIDEGWGVREDTDPESPVQTAARVKKSEQDASHYIRRATVESQIPQFLSAITAPNWSAALDHDDAAPQSEMHDEPTRRVAAAAVTPPTGERKAFGKKRRGTPNEERTRKTTALESLRTRAVELIESCRAELASGAIESAVSDAEAVLRDADRAPAPGIADLIDPVRPMFEDAFERFIEPKQRIPIFVLGPESLPKKDFDHRAATILGRIDGAMTVEHLLDASDLSRFDALRIMSALVRARAIKLL